MGNLFSLCYSYRDEPVSPIHRPQFLMLEWYELDVGLEETINRCNELISFLELEFKSFHIPFIIKKNLPNKVSIRELFLEYCQVDILEYQSKESIRKLIAEKFTDIVLASKEQLEWDDYFFLIFLNKIEPKLTDYPLLFIKDYPAQLSALAKINSNDSRLCKRFEWLINGVEIGNCFEELQDLEEQRKRFKEQMIIKRKYYKYELPEPTILYKALENGLPNCSGIAVGMERLFCALTGYEFPLVDEAIF